MEIAGTNFPEELLNALQDDQLVIFAGAGVSMGPPANLPSFGRLTDQISQRCNIPARDKEPEDQTLGRIADQNIPVQEIACEILNESQPSPTPLHKEIIRLHKNLGKARVVTTNFDQLFEKEAHQQQKSFAEIYRAPALPLGRNFTGLVHLHGCITRPQEIILTDQDFGRAYLTENEGWARRFLVDLFNSHPVLFIGYSHRDPVITYISRALPPNADNQRYALIGDHRPDDEVTHWENHKIKLVRFPQKHRDDYEGMSQAVGCLAEFLSGGPKARRDSIAEAAQQSPLQMSKQHSDIIKDALTDALKTSFFTQHANGREWVNWLDANLHLDNLFNDIDMSASELLLASWLVSKFLSQEPETILDLVARHHGRINPALWRQIAYNVDTPQPMGRKKLAQLASLLLQTMPQKAVGWRHDRQRVTGLLHHLATKCHQEGLLAWLPPIFEAMTGTIIEFQPVDPKWILSDEPLVRPKTPLPLATERYRLAATYEATLKPNLNSIAVDLLQAATARISDNHRLQSAWLTDQIFRPAIVEDITAIEMGRAAANSNSIEFLVGVARECLEWTAINRPEIAYEWANRNAHAQSPLLRRLAVYAIGTTADQNGDAKIQWLLSHTDIHDSVIPKEALQSAVKAYPHATPEQRKALLNEILRFQHPDHSSPNQEVLSARRHYIWMNRLQSADPQCELASRQLDQILKKHPEFETDAPPNGGTTFLRWSRIQSPWDAEQLLSKTPAEQLDQLLTYRPTSRIYERSELIDEVGIAARKSPDWGIELAVCLKAKKKWQSDLWRGLIESWAKSTFETEQLTTVLGLMSRKPLRENYPVAIAFALSQLARDGNLLDTLALTKKADALANKLWTETRAKDHLNIGGSNENLEHWFTEAINHEAGHIVLYWLAKSEHWLKCQSPPQRLPKGTRMLFEEVVKNSHTAGKLGQCILTSELPLLAYADAKWTKDWITPLFKPQHSNFQSNWSSFLCQGGVRTYPAAEAMREVIRETLQHLNENRGGITLAFRELFIRHYAQMLGLFAENDQDPWIKEFFKNSADADRETFTNKLLHTIMGLDQNIQKEWWRGWLKGYWNDRLLNIHGQLSDRETQAMRDMTIYLNAVFPEAVELAVQMKPISLGHGFLTYQHDNNELVSQYPAAMAELIIHAGQIREPGDNISWLNVKPTIDHLLESSIPEEVKENLEDLKAKHNIQ